MLGTLGVMGCKHASLFSLGFSRAMSFENRLSVSLSAWQSCGTLAIGSLVNKSSEESEDPWSEKKRLSLIEPSNRSIILPLVTLMKSVRIAMMYLFMMSAFDVVSIVILISGGRRDLRSINTRFCAVSGCFLRSVLPFLIISVDLC